MGLDTHEIAWAAGFFDGEGTTRFGHYLSRGRLCRSFSISIAQAEPESLNRFRKALFGLGKISPDRQEGRTDMWVWRVTNWRDVQACVAAMWPFLCTPKRDQARRALSHVAEMANHPPRGRDGRQIRCKRGHDYSQIRMDKIGQRHCLECEQERGGRCVDCGRPKAIRALRCRACYFKMRRDAVLEGDRRAAVDRLSLVLG